MKKGVILSLVLFAIILSITSIAVPADKPEKITFIHYKDGKIKTIDNTKPQVQTCYKLLGVKWNEFPISYVINPSNSWLDEIFVANAIFSSAEEWDSYTSKELFSNSYIVDYSATLDSEFPDYKNEYVFGLYPQEEVIAITNIWGYFSGAKSQRRIIEYDVLFNTHYFWGDATNSTIAQYVMDLQNIATHETGHGIGLDDLYNSCVQETMYGYSNYGETSKRSLNSGDIAGIQKLYRA